MCVYVCVCTLMVDGSDDNAEPIQMSILFKKKKGNL